MVYECNSSCHCKDWCQNRVVQKGVHVKLEVFQSRHKVISVLNSCFSDFHLAGTLFSSRSGLVCIWLQDAARNVQFCERSGLCRVGLCGLQSSFHVVHSSASMLEKSSMILKQIEGGRGDAP